MKKVRTRFAPSPTGSLHLGNLRVAVFNHVFARHHEGAFIVRIEDTDVERNIEGSLEGILADLRWAGLDWDEGPEIGGPCAPYRQSERGELYRTAALTLRDQGRAYPCFCTDEEVEAVREGGRDTPDCPGRCRTLTSQEVQDREAGGTAWVLRFAIPRDGIQIEDHVRGVITFDSNDVGDFVILRADERATYNFAVVVDDVAMEISHVIRGSGHLSNTPKQAVLFDALGASRPQFVHLPMVLGPDRRKLSKREGAAGLHQLREEGFHPDAVVNYLSLLGWSPGDDREVLSRPELVEAMDLERVGASDTIFDPEKLRWMSQQHIAAMSTEELTRELAGWVDRTRYPVSDENLPLAVDAIRTRLTTFADVNEHLAFVHPDEGGVERARKELAEEDGVARVLECVREALSTVQPWDADALGAAVREGGKEAGVRGRALFHPVRLAVSGSREGPDLGKLLAAAGRKRSLERLDAALRFLR